MFETLTDTHVFIGFQATITVIQTVIISFHSAVFVSVPSYYSSNISPLRPVAIQAFYQVICKDLLSVWPKLFSKL